jgi:hypothetical protein
MKLLYIDSFSYITPFQLVGIFALVIASFVLVLYFDRIKKVLKG